jgi:hypothetical protein
MTRFRIALALLLVLAAVSGCTSIAGSGGVRIRFSNGGAAELTNITFQSGDASVQLARLAPGELSPYSVHASTYHYGYLRFTVNGAEQVLQPIDYVGETPITSGAYTFRIVPAASAGGYPVLTMIRDECPWARKGHAPCAVRARPHHRTSRP